jgi:hypothetical protein
MPADSFLRIATDRLDLPAELISEMHRLRWLIENFFRMLKQLLGCRHLLSTKPHGVKIQVYCGIIACLLIMLCTGRAPTKRTFEMVCFFPAGLQTGSLLTAEPQINNLRLTRIRRKRTASPHLFEHEGGHGPGV